jgi:hypothetical protein
MKTFLLVFFCALAANAASFKGHPKVSGSEVMTFEEPLDKFEENSDEFLISIEKHSAFYSLPKSKEHAEQVREFLNSQKKKKQVLILEIDPASANIYSIETK